MSDLFLDVLNTSFAATWVVLAVLPVASCAMLIYLWKSRRFRTGEK